jgi:hypothetical protein
VTSKSQTKDRPKKSEMQSRVMFSSTAPPQFRTVITFIVNKTRYFWDWISFHQNSDAKAPSAAGH